MLFCGVFDGHGPYGHMVARHVRDALPSKLSSAFKKLQINGCNPSDVDDEDDDDEDDDEDDEGSSSTTKDSRDVDKIHNSLHPSWKASLIETFKEVDEEIGSSLSINCMCSGTTAVTIVKQVLLVTKICNKDAIVLAKENFWLC